jgi:hypothetical protein
MNLDPKSLELFAAVVEHGSIARAAEHHHIAAAAVSKRISELEKDRKFNATSRSICDSGGLGQLPVSREEVPGAAIEPPVSHPQHLEHGL